MPRLRFQFLFLVLAVLCIDRIHSFETPDYLETEDLPLVMEEILSHHVDHKQVTPELLARSLEVYIDHFDIDKVYLLEKEVEPYVQPSKRLVSRLMDRYERNDLTTYENLNQLVQNSIRRSRAIRYKLERDLEALFSAQSPEAKKLAEEMEERDFAATTTELEDRIRDQLLAFIEYQRQTIGKETIRGREQEVIDLYERNLRLEENKYLYVDNRNQPLPAHEQEHFFALHVMKALAKSLDSHTAFFSYAEAYDMKVRLEKGFKGVGIVLQESIDGVTITRLIEGGPAEKSGKLQENDRIVSVDGTSILKEPFEDILDRIRGEEGSEILLGIKRTTEKDGEWSDEYFDVTLTREQVEISEKRVDTSYEPFANGIIGTIKLYSFYHGDNGVSSVRDVRNAIRDFYKEGDLKGLVLDLRDNTGGFLMQAVKVAGLFISNGVVVVAKYGDGEMRYFRDIDGHKYFDGPLVVLTSRGSASAAEIVAQALQDYGSGVIVGDETTYGKGSIQHQTVTDSNSQSYFKVTVGRYYTVSGKSTQIGGVEADIVVPTSVNQERLGERYLDHPLKGGSIASSFDDQLLDLDFEAQRWYRKYYSPSLQEKKPKWRQMIPVLSKNSQYRLENNKNFQEFLVELGIEEEVEEKEEETAENGSDVEVDEDSYGVEDLQLREAINILKDMIFIDLSTAGFGSFAQTLR